MCVLWEPLLVSLRFDVNVLVLGFIGGHACALVYEKETLRTTDTRKVTVFTWVCERNVFRCIS